jgi:hypothetical protein
MKPRTLRVMCVGCGGELDCFMDEDFGEAFCCKGCGISVSVNFDKNVIEIDAKKVEQ